MLTALINNGGKYMYRTEIENRPEYNIEQGKLT